MKRRSTWSPKEFSCQLCLRAKSTVRRAMKAGWSYIEITYDDGSRIRRYTCPECRAKRDA